MKLKPLQFSRLCAPFRKWRYLWLIAPLLFAFIHPGIGLTAFSLMAASLALYRLLVQASRLPAASRPPRPEDALAETVLVDASLVGQGTLLRAAAQPVDAVDSLSLRMGSGALLLGSAMTITADDLPQADVLAIHRAVSKINIVPQRLSSHQPVLARTEEGGVRCIRVKDGLNERCYYRGAANSLIPLCQHIWEGEVRPMTEHDVLRLQDTARYISQAKCRVYAYATCLADEAPIFLGFAGIGEEIDSDARREIVDMRDLGLTVMLHTADDPETDAESLRALLRLPDLHAQADIHLTDGDSPDPKALSIRRRRGENLMEPIHQLRNGFTGIEMALRRFLLMLCAALLPCLAAGWTAIAASALMLGGVFFIGDKGHSRLPVRKTLIIHAVLTAIAWLFLGTAEGTSLAHGLLTLLIALGCCARLCDVRTKAAIKAEKRALCYVLCIAAAGLVVSIVLGVVQGTALLSVLFALLMGAAMAGLMVFGD